MDIIYDFPQEENNERYYIALGNFDGVHIGHQELITTMVTDARNKNSKTLVLTFDPHPAKVLAPKGAPKLLVPPGVKADLISKLGVDMLALLPFDRNIARLTPREFIENVLIKYFRPLALYVGYNYTFGDKGEGTPEQLEDYGRVLGYEVKITPPVSINDMPISSTLIREHLSKGDIPFAKECLGRWPFVKGKVIPGNGLGRKLGFPTANMSLDNDIQMPSRGVYVGYTCVGGNNYHSIANVGVKPTVSPGQKPTMEVHLLNVERDLYGKTITFSFRDRIRGERKFNSLNELKSQIVGDAEHARRMAADYKKSTYFPGRI